MVNVGKYYTSPMDGMVSVPTLLPGESQKSKIWFNWMDPSQHLCQNASITKNCWPFPLVNKPPFVCSFLCETNSSTHLIIHQIELTSPDQPSPSWWFQPLPKIWVDLGIISPSRDEHQTKWNHHPVYQPFTVIFLIISTQIEVVEKPMDENNWKHQPSPIHPHLQDLWVVTNSWCLDDDLEIQEWFNRGKGPY